jgi:quinol monooxygenase YgiN
MKSALHLLAGAIWLAGAAAAQAQTAPAGGAVYVVTYVEVGAAAAQKAAAGLRRLANAGRRERGNEGFLALREHDRPGRFAVVEAWHDKAAFDAHAAAEKAAFDALQPILASPPDARICNALDVAGSGAVEPGGKGTVYVLTHVDVVPSGKDEAIGLVKALAAASRQQDGDGRFDVYQQANRANHMTVFEAWQDRAAHNAHVVAEATRQFRGKLTPLAGALYDERLYEAVR